MFYWIINQEFLYLNLSWSCPSGTPLYDAVVVQGLRLINSWVTVFTEDLYNSSSVPLCTQTLKILLVNSGHKSSWQVHKLKPTQIHCLLLFSGNRLIFKTAWPIIWPKNQRTSEQVSSVTINRCIQVAVIHCYLQRIMHWHIQSEVQHFPHGWGVLWSCPTFLQCELTPSIYPKP